MSWPDDADGDVFRRLEANGFDFSRSYAVDYNVDFDNWPPAPGALKLLEAQYGNVEVYEPDDEGGGYVLFKVVGPVTYEGVTSVQRRTSAAMQPYGGVCESWGVLHECGLTRRSSADVLEARLNLALDICWGRRESE